MAKSKSHTSEEDLKGENRKLLKQIKHLKKELGAANKRLSKYENMVDTFIYHGSEETLDSAKAPKGNCPRCGDGKLQISDVANVRKIVTCTECDYREVKKN